MARVKNAQPAIPANPFRCINQHGVALLDPEHVRESCLQSGKDV